APTRPGARRRADGRAGPPHLGRGHRLAARRGRARWHHGGVQPRPGPGRGGRAPDRPAAEGGGRAVTGVLTRVNPLVLIVLALLGMVASLAVREPVTAAVTVAVVLLAGVLAMPRRVGPPVRFVAVALGT